MDFYATYFGAFEERLRDADSEMLRRIAELFRQTHAHGGKVVLGGNGGSAAIASHVAVDLTKVAGVRAINFNESDLLTCFANDYGYEHWLERALQFYADPSDTVVLISSSGRSPNVVNAAKAARARELALVTLSGFDADNPLRALGDLNLWANSRIYNVVETIHQLWLLAVADSLVSTTP